MHVCLIHDIFFVEPPANIVVEKKCQVQVQVQYTLFKNHYIVHNVGMDTYIKYMLLSELLRARVLYSKQYYGARS